MNALIERMRSELAQKKRLASGGGEKNPSSSGALVERPLVMAVAILGAAAVLGALMPLLLPGWSNLTAFFLDKQDRFLLFLFALLAVIARVLQTRAASRSLPDIPPIIIAGAVFVICAFGHFWLLGGYDLTRDEQMAAFDAQIFGQGLLAQPLGPPWRVHAKALNTMFMTLGENPIGWASAYLPMNAALRALVDQMGDAALTGPFLSAVGALALWKCARLLWPEDREAAIVAILLYALSGQILVAGMTAYAMPAHLTFNLVWLWLFLLDRRRYDLACLFVGLVATGLHQPLFHPLFVAPFLVLTLRDRRWSRLALFIGGYALICGFWLAWPHLTRHFLTDAPAAATGADFWARLAQVLAVGDASRWPNMAANLLRFVAWQPWLLTPLMALGFLRGAPRPWVFALAASVVLPALAMAILLPYQGHGFGYRYLHGVLGPAILLAAAGFCAPKDQREKLRFAFRWQALSTLCVVAPLQFWFAHHLYTPYAQADAALRRANVDLVIVEADRAPFAADLVINRPDLTNRPLRLLAQHVDDDLLAAVCKPGVTVAIAPPGLFLPIRDYFAMQAEAPRASEGELARKLIAAGCAVREIAGSP